jgi:hypothetical protein
MTKWQYYFSPEFNFFSCLSVDFQTGDSPALDNPFPLTGGFSGFKMMSGNRGNALPVLRNYIHCPRIITFSRLLSPK